MNKKKLISLFIAFDIIILSLIFYFFVFNSDFFNKNNTLKEDLFVRNISWDTSFLDNVPYKKSELLEFNIIFPWDWKNKITLDLNKIKENFKIQKILIDDKEQNQDNIIIDETNSIKIIWEAIDNWILKRDDYKNLIKDYEKIPKEEIKKEIENINFSWSLNIKFDKNNLNSNINNLLEITWTWREFIKYVNIWWISLIPINENNKTFLTISKNTFASWEYFIILQLQNNELITLNEKIYFTHSSSKVNIANITPKVIKNDTDKYIVLQWNWFSKVISIQLSNNVVLKTTSFDIINDNVLSVKIPKDLDIWNYYFNIMTTTWITELKNNIFTIN